MPDPARTHPFWGEYQIRWSPSSLTAPTLSSLCLPSSTNCTRYQFYDPLAHPLGSSMPKIRYLSINPRFLARFFSVVHQKQILAIFQDFVTTKSLIQIIFRLPDFREWIFFTYHNIMFISENIIVDTTLDYNFQDAKPNSVYKWINGNCDVHPEKPGFRVVPTTEWNSKKLAILASKKIRKLQNLLSWHTAYVAIFGKWSHHNALRFYSNPCQQQQVADGTPTVSRSIEYMLPQKGLQAQPIYRERSAVLPARPRSPGKSCGTAGVCDYVPRTKRHHCRIHTGLTASVASPTIDVVDATVYSPYLPLLHTLKRV